MIQVIDRWRHNPTKPAAQFLRQWQNNPHFCDRRITIGFVHRGDHRIELYSFRVINPQERGNGLGTKLMHAVTALADRTGTEILLYPDPGNRERLICFYGRFGFHEVKDFAMLRPPQS